MQHMHHINVKKGAHHANTDYNKQPTND